MEYRTQAEGNEQTMKKTRCFCNFHALLALLLLAGCGRDANPMADDCQSDARTQAKGAPIWNERTADLFRFIFQDIEPATTNRPCFITITPESSWFTSTAWESVPAAEHEQFLAPKGYRPAKEACHQHYQIFDKATGIRGCMAWVGIIRWISDTEAEVEVGTYFGQMGSGSLSAIYEKVDGRWRVKEYGVIKAS